jgi:hypothetical protein
MLVIHNGNVKFYFESTFQQHSAIDIKRISQLTPRKQFPKMYYWAWDFLSRRCPRLKICRVGKIHIFNTSEQIGAFNHAYGRWASEP